MGGQERWRRGRVQSSKRAGCGPALAGEAPEARALRLRLGGAYFDLVGYALDLDGARADYPLTQDEGSPGGVRWTPACKIKGSGGPRAPPRFQSLFPPSVTPKDAEALHEQLRQHLADALDELNFPRDLNEGMQAAVLPLRSLWAAELSKNESPRAPRPSFEGGGAPVEEHATPEPRGVLAKKGDGESAKASGGSAGKKSGGASAPQPCKTDLPPEKSSDTKKQEALPVSDAPKPYGELGSDPNPFGHGLDRCNIALAVVLMLLAVIVVWYLP